MVAVNELGLEPADSALPLSTGLLPAELLQCLLAEWKQRQNPLTTGHFPTCLPAGQEACDVAHSL